jgi:hypothetical protein
MSSIASRWPVVVAVPLLADERKADGQLSDAAVERTVAAGRDAYFDLCTTVDRATLHVQRTEVHRRGAEVTEEVTVSVSVVELYPDSFVMNARIRPAETDGVVADVACTVSAGDVTTAMRDELIALAHAASHYH